MTQAAEAGSWASHLARHLNVPIAQILALPASAVEREIASMISESAIAEAERRSKARDDIPEPTDLYHRAVARVMDGHEAARRIAVKARQDEALAEMKANRR